VIVLIMNREFCRKRFLKEILRIGKVEIVVYLRENAEVKVEGKREVSLRFIRKSRHKCTYGKLTDPLFV